MEFFLRIEIKIPFVIQGFLTSLRCRREHDFSGACLSIVCDTVLAKLLKILLKFSSVNGESPRKTLCREKRKFHQRFRYRIWICCGENQIQS